MIVLKPESSLYINILAGVVLITALISGYNKGLIKGIVNLIRWVVALVVASIFSGPLAEVFPLLNYRQSGVPVVVSDALELSSSKIVYFVGIVLAVYLITIILEWLMGFVDNIPIIKSVNKLGGLAFGLISGFFHLYLILLILVSPLFRDSQPVIDQTLLKPVQDVSGLISSGIDESIALQKAALQESLNEEEANTVEAILSQYGLAQDQIVDYLEKLK